MGHGHGLIGEHHRIPCVAPLAPHSGIPELAESKIGKEE